MNNEELAIACILYVSEKEKLAPQQVLWELLPIANRQTPCDGLGNEKEQQATRQGSEPDTENNSVPGYACR